jgi:hypothetical protein
VSTSWRVSHVSRGCMVQDKDQCKKKQYMQGPDRCNVEKQRNELTEPLEVSTDQPIWRPSPPNVSKKRNQLLFVSSVCCSPCQSSSSRGDMDSLSSGSTSRDILLGCIKGECSSMASIKSTRGLPSVVGRPSPEPERSRPNETSFGRGLGRWCEVVLMLGVV